ncbi:terminal EAR1-like 1 [Euphorbia peplus]|nr:terminal EAR1-like 1 [Euphorbia peplus]
MASSTKLNPEAPEFHPNNHRQIHYYPSTNPLPHLLIPPPNPNPSFYFYSSAPPSSSSFTQQDSILEVHEAASPRGGKRRWNGNRYCNWRPPNINYRREKFSINKNKSWRPKADSSDFNTTTNPKRRHHNYNNHDSTCRKIKPSLGASKNPLPVESDGEITTVMIKNIPNRYTRKLLMEMIDEHCKNENEESKKRNEKQVSAFDFLYLPIDFENNANKGYAFVNFTDPKGVCKFKGAVHNKRWPLFLSNKICSIAYARVQGKEELVRHFQGSVFECNSEDYLPVCFSPARDGSGNVVEQRVIGKRVTSSTFKLIKKRN